jgi:NADH-quinone oxidoreductase subunit F
VDLHFIPDAAPTPAERAAVDAIVASGLPPHPLAMSEGEKSGAGHVGRRARAGGRAVRERRHLLLPLLLALQARVGYVSRGGLNYVCEQLGVAPAEAFGVASFYALLSTEPGPPAVAHVCDDLACRMSGGLDLIQALERRLGPARRAHGAHATTPDPDAGAAWLTSPCLGQCERAPAVFLQRTGATPGDLTLAPADIESVVTALEAGEMVAPPNHRGRGGSPAAPQTQAPDRAGLRLLRRVGWVDPESLDDYRTQGGYTALRAAIRLGPAGVIREIVDSRLLGRGGAAFPTGRKWQDVAAAPVRPHYLVCNADESEPGTFKDRVLLEEDPFAILEAMTIAGFATGCERGYLYVRGEYPLAQARLRNAIDRARQRGFLGDDILGEGIRFDVELRSGAGAYICGEETALFNSIEGFRGEPRNKPPYPTQAGLFAKPTLVDNVETLANVLDIVLEGGPAFARIGTERSTGPKLFCLSGCVAQPGVYEVPFGSTLREVLDLAGGARDGRTLRAVLLGGAAGSFVTSEEFDVPLTFEGVRAIGASLGSGVVMAFDDQADLTDAVARIASFFRSESCGQCVPCRVGTQRQEEAVRRLVSAAPLDSRAAELARLQEIALVMGDASICGLGQTAASAIGSAIRKLGIFGEELGVP